MARLIWSEAAHEDLRTLRRSIARESKQAAARVAGEIMESVRRLRTFPESGRIVPEFDDPLYRELIVGPYRVLYRHDAERELAEIMIVIHGSRLLPPVL